MVRSTICIYINQQKIKVYHAQKKAKAKKKIRNIKQNYNITKKQNTNLEKNQKEITITSKKSKNYRQEEH
nr:hypothetical protein [Mycoplasmopsis bovis]